MDNEIAALKNSLFDHRAYLSGEEDLETPEGIIKAARHVLDRIADDKPDLGDGPCAIDLPNSDPDCPMITYDYYDSSAEALKDAKEKFGADDQGRICIISVIPVLDTDILDRFGR